MLGVMQRHGLVLLNRRLALGRRKRLLLLLLLGRPLLSRDTVRLLLLLLLHGVRLALRRKCIRVVLQGRFLRLCGGRGGHVSALPDSGLPDWRAAACVDERDDEEGGGVGEERDPGEEGEGFDR